MDHNAFSSRKNNRNGLSAAEFQRNLYNWFENRGLLDELRAHLRQQMVMALRDTSLRPTPSRRLKSNISPKIQAINLLVAEFLLQQDHHYTLSVFTSEVPLLRSMPEFTVSGTQISAGNNTPGESMPRFHHQDVKDIMEILGLSLDTEMGNRIYCQYQDNSEGIALLTCVLQNAPFVLDGRSHNGENNMLPGTSGTEHPTRDSKSDRNLKDTESSNKESNSVKQLAELYNTEMQEVLYQSQMKSQHIKQLQEEIRRFQDCELERVRKEEEAKYKKELIDRESRIQADICRREEEITRKFKDTEDRLARERQSLDNDIQMKQNKFSDLAAQLQEQQLDVANKLQKVEDHAEELKHQERMLEETKQKEAILLADRTSKLDVRQQQLHQEFERLNVERETMSYMQHELEENRLQLVEASQSLIHSQSQTPFLNGIQQQCAHLRLELNATRHKLDSLTELHSQKSSHSKVPARRQCSVEKIDKSLQTALPVPADDLAAAVPERLPAQNRELELELAQSQNQLQEQQQQHQYLIEMMRQVQQENQELQGFTQQQRLRIDELTSHAAQLVNQLEDAHTAITLLSSHPTPEPGPSDPHILPSLFLRPGSGTITVPPLIAPPPPPPPPPLPPRSPHHSLRTVHSRQMGAGEELNYVSPPSTIQPITSFPTSSQHSSVYHRREWRKKPPRRLMVYNNTTSSDETSPTEEILQEARRRLRRLEEESEAVDRSYQDFRLRHSDSLAATASVLFHPMPSIHFQQQSSNLNHRSFTPSRPLYSSATGGNQNTQTPFIFRNANYDAPPFPQRNGTFFNPTFSRNTSTYMSSLLPNERIPSTMQYTIGSRIRNQYAFPQRLQTLGTVDNTATIISDRFTTQSQAPGIGSILTASSRNVINTAVTQTDSRFTLQSQPSTSIELLRRKVNQRKDTTDTTPSRPDRRGNLSHTKLLDTHSSASVDPDLHNQYQAKNVSFGCALKTITVYNSPQVSSSIECAGNQNNSHKMSDDVAVNVIPVDHAAASWMSSKITRPMSTTQGSSRSDSWGEDLVIKEFDELPSCVLGSSTSSAQDDDWISLQFQKNNSSRDIQDYTKKNSVISKLSNDNVSKLRHKSSSYLSPSLEHELIMKRTKSVDKDISDKTSLNENQNLKHTERQLKKLFPVSDISKSHSSVLGALSGHETNPSGSFLSSGTTITTGSVSNEADLQAALSACNVSSTTFPSDKDPSFEAESNNEGSSIPVLNLVNDSVSNKQLFNANVDVIPIQEEDALSEISGSGTITTVQNKGMKTIENSYSIIADTVISSIPDIRENVAKGTAMDKDDRHTSEEVDERLYTRTDNQGGTQVLVEQRQTNFKEKEGSQSFSGFASVSEESDNDDKKFTSSLKAERDDTAESVDAGSDQAISIGEESKRDDSSKDDFW